jgi:drug/metabolite transporter (DMT)-like permease
MSAAIQMIAGGLTVAIAGSLLGEWSRWHLTGRGVAAIAYLVVFGSIVGYSAYSYALRHASATIVGTYAYVNPVIAVLLGWLLLGEQISGRMIAAIALTLAAVVWIQLSHKTSSVVSKRSSVDLPTTDNRQPTTSLRDPEAA